MPAKISRETQLCSLRTSEGVLMVPYTLRRSRRARYLRLNLTHEKQAILTLPIGTSEKQALNFLQEKADWVSDNFKKQGAKKSVGLMAHLQKKPRLSFFGFTADLKIGFTDSKSKISWNREEKTVSLCLNSKEPLEDLATGLLRSFAAKVIPPRVHEFADRQQQEVFRVSIRDQSTRWGSCSGKKTLSLNWRLILLPAELHDYVIYHELAHLTHFDHSEDFWNLLKQYDPKARANDRRLTKIGAEIINLGRRKRTSLEKA